MKRDLDLERAVYGMLEFGAMTPEKSTLFKKPLALMVADKLVRRNQDGSHELVAPSAGVTAPGRARAKVPVMVTLTARVPAEYLEILDRIGPTRSEALRSLLQAAGVEGNTRTKK